MAAIYQHPASLHLSAPSAAPGLRGLLAAAVERLTLWRDRSRERAYLVRLDDHTLHDIGLSRAQAEFEASRAFWEA